MQALTLLNASAGTAAKLGGKDAPNRVRELLARAGMDTEVRPVQSDELRDAAADAARAPSADAVIAGGGDGTVNCVAAALAGADKPMGVLPLGTLNHFAKDLGIRPPLEDAARALASGEVRAVDVGDVNGHIFVNNASIGLYPRMVGRREELHRRLGHNKWVALIFAMGSVFRRCPTLRVRLSVEGRTIVRDTPFVFVGNNAYDFKLLAVGERSSLDRGVLGLYFANRSGRFAMFRLAIRALFGRLEQAKDFEAMTVREFWIETGKRHVSVATDGEIHRLTPPLHFRSRHLELKVIAPAPAPTAPASTESVGAL